MNTKINLQTILIVFMVCVTVFISTNTYANAQLGEDTTMLENAPESEIMLDPIPDPDGPGYIMVSPVDFKAYYSTSAIAYSNGYVYNPSTDDSTLAAGLTLPHGATIKKLTLYFYDHTVYDMTLYLLRIGQDNYPVEMAYIRTFQSFSSFRNISATDINLEIVDNQSYSYLLFLDLPGGYGTNLMLTGVRIDYAYTSYEPMIMR